MAEKEEKQSTKKDQQPRQVVLFDEDEFYGLTLDMVLFNLKNPNCIQVRGRQDFDKFNRDLVGKKYKSGVYIIDENFGWGKVDLGKLIGDIKKNDSKAVFICYSVSDQNTDEIANSASYDHIVMKTGLSNEKTLIKTLSEILGVEFVINNNDPEYGDSH